jgi:GNAT superfamily N-acetyltransferase
MVVVNASNYKIGWLSVSKQARNKGVATALLNHILQSVDTPSEIIVTTIGEDLPEGQPGSEGGSRQNFKLTIADKASL